MFCIICEEEILEKESLFCKYLDEEENLICSNCDRELFEDTIGYEED